MWVQQVLKAMDSRNLNRPMAATAATQFDRLVQLVCSLDAIGHDHIALDIAKLLCHGHICGRRLAIVPDVPYLVVESKRLVRGVAVWWG